MIYKILVIGNAAGGKTKLSRVLASIYRLPITHVDSIQFLPGMKIRNLSETRAILNDVIENDSWIIDGYGPLDLLEKRFAAADKIIFIDLPIWRHYWWFCKRQVTSILFKRRELPAGCNEFEWAHSKKVMQTMWSMHQNMRPELLRILKRESLISKVILIQSIKKMNKILRHGLVI